jgi:hypothetical protein
MYRLRRMRQSMSIFAKSGQTRIHSLRRMHGMPGMHLSLPCRRRIADVHIAQTSDIALDDGGRTGNYFHRINRICTMERSIGQRHPRFGIQTAHSPTQRADAPIKSTKEGSHISCVSPLPGETQSQLKISALSLRFPPYYML